MKIHVTTLEKINCFIRQFVVTSFPPAKIVFLPSLLFDICQTFSANKTGCGCTPKVGLRMCCFRSIFHDGTSRVFSYRPKQPFLEHELVIHKHITSLKCTSSN